MKKTQREQIIDFMKKYGSITPMDAFMELGCTKLATRISEMIRDGVKIRKTPVKSVTRTGRKVIYMRYSLAE